jgi:hypothetical protein
MNLLDLAIKNPDAVILIAGALGGLIWKRGKNVAVNDLFDRLVAIARQQFPELLADPDAHTKAHGVIERAIWRKLEKLGVKKTTQLDELVDEVIDHALGELAGKLMERDLRRVTASLKRTDAILKTATEPAS